LHLDAGKAPHPTEGRTQKWEPPLGRLFNGGSSKGGQARPPNAPSTTADAQLDLLDFANLRIFGNSSFRHQQKKVVEAILQVRDHRQDSIEGKEKEKV
jgi:hypothetical protein